MNKINKDKLNFYLSNSESCSYLENRKEKKIFLVMDDITKSDEYQFLIKNGFRRSHNILYNQVCDNCCLLYTSPSPRDKRQYRMPSSA